MNNIPPGTTMVKVQMDRILESAVVLSWKDLLHPSQKGLIRIEYAPGHNERIGGFVLTTIMKWTSLIVLTGAPFFWRPAGGYAIMLQFVICLSAILVSCQAARSGKQLWTSAFAGLAVLLNPVIAVPVSQSIFLWINMLCITMFLAAVKFLKTDPKLSIPSITYPGPPSQSL
jgi:hypothetical protein